MIKTNQDNNDYYLLAGFLIFLFSIAPPLLSTQFGWQGPGTHF